MANIDWNISKKYEDYMVYSKTHPPYSGEPEPYIYREKDIPRKKDDIGILVKDSVKMSKEEIKKEINKCLTAEIKKAVIKEINELTTDVKKLKEEKTELSKSISVLKSQLIKAEKDIQKEIKAMEQLLKNKAKEILRYQNLDIR